MADVHLGMGDKPIGRRRWAIAEGYIVDVSASIISYKTLYNLHCHFVPPPDEEEKVYPKGVVAKALMNVAFQDDGLIQYKAEVMLRIFEEKVMPLIGGRAKAMIVTSSRVAGLRYFQIIKEKVVAGNIVVQGVQRPRAGNNLNWIVEAEPQ